MKKYGFRKITFFHDLDYVYANNEKEARKKIRNLRGIDVLRNYEVWKVS